MNRLVRSIFFAAVLVLVILGVGIALLPHLIGSETVRSELMAASAEATGREVRFGDLRFGLSPPKLQIDDVYISGKGRDAVPFLQCRTIDLRFSLLSLLALSPVVDSLVVDGAKIHLIQTKDGIIFPGSSQALGGLPPAMVLPDVSPTDPIERSESVVTSTLAASLEPDDSSERSSYGSDTLKVAVQYVALRDSELHFEDRVKQPASTISIYDISAEARGDLLANDLVFEIEGRLGSGGSLFVNGELAQGSLLEASSVLEKINISSFTPYVPSDLNDLEGLLSGNVSFLRGDEDRLEFDLDLKRGEFQIEDIKMSGLLSAEGEFSGTWNAGAGKFKIDATDATLEYGTFFRKPVGTPATAAGIITTRDGSLRFEETKLKISSLEAEVSSLVGEKTTAEVTARQFSVAPLLGLFPDFGNYGIKGALSFQKFNVSIGSSLSFGGYAGLHAISFSPFEGGPPVLIDAVLRGARDRLIGNPLNLRLANQTVPLVIEVEGLSEKPRVALAGVAEGLDSSALLKALGQSHDFLSGPLAVNLDLTTSLGADALTSLKGVVGFEIRPGRLRGVSLLEDTLSQLGLIGRAALGISSSEDGATELNKLYGDKFEVLSGRFSLQDGIANTRDLRLVYQNYEVSLVGDISMETLALDMEGSIALSETVQDALSKPDNQGVPKSVIPLAHVGGTIEDPRVQVSARQAFRITRKVLAGKVRELSEKLDEKLGGESGKRVFEALESLLGGADR